MSLRTLVLAGIAGVVLNAGAASAAPVAPSFQTFGDLPGATFGGSGIPTDPTAIRTISTGPQTVTLGLAATPRFGSPALGNDGAGTYFAEPGRSLSPTNLEGALWNFSFFVGIEGAGSQSIQSIGAEILYDFDPAADTELANHGVWSLSQTAAVFGGSPTLFEDSQNLLFDFLATDFPPLITAPLGAFDPDVVGEYTFMLRLTNLDAQPVSIRVKVGAVPLPAAGPLAAGAFALLGVAAWRRRA